MTRTAHTFRIPLLLAALLVAPSPLLAGAAAPHTEIQGEQEAAPPPIDMTSSWPCVQRKVESLSVAAIWDGPSIEGVKGWFREPGMSDLIELLSTRRVPVEEAEQAITTYVDGVPKEQRDEKLLLLFAGLFDKMAGQRRGVMSGIEKYQKSQQARAKELERQSTVIADLESKQPPGTTEDTPEIAALREKFNWAQRIFQERQSSIPLACELPVLIEERLYALTRTIRGLMTS
ncbi:MAG: hypothetical protein J0H65_05300 [Rhizobiales bacterium]|nr:hypothetical protein [Hyphomicrobiales bacterium]